MLENIRLSFQGVWSHKMRSLLTMLGIIIGIASIIAIASTIQGTNEQLKQNLLGAGNNTVNVKLCRSDSEYEFDDYTGIPAGVPVFTESDREKMLAVEGVEDITFLHQAGAIPATSGYRTRISRVRPSWVSTTIISIPAVMRSGQEDPSSTKITRISAA